MYILLIYKLEKSFYLKKERDLVFTSSTQVKK